MCALVLPRAGKTAFFQGTVTLDKCVVCPAHMTKFDLATGAVKGEWCPKVRRARLTVQQA
jgi:nitrite reductase/ring-hydroxylating ferredoxin subunit